MRKEVRAHRDHLRACSGETAMPEVWEQEGYLRARPCFRGDIEEELKRVDVNGQHTEAARTTTPTAAAEAWFSDLAHVPDLCWTTVMIGLAWLSGISAVPVAAPPNK